MPSLGHVLINWSKQLVVNSKNASFRVYSERRLYSRWMRRKPVEVLPAEQAQVLHSGKKYQVVDPSELFETDEDPRDETARPENRREQLNSGSSSYSDAKNSETKVKPVGHSAKESTQKKIGKVQDEPKSSASKRQTLVPKSTVTVVEAERKLSSMMLAVKSKKNREKEQKILLEGRRLIADAIQAGAEVEALFYSREENLEDIPLKNVPVFKVPYKKMELWTDLTTSPGVFGIFRLPDRSHLKFPKPAVPLTVICDNVREPGNLGAILRCCAAVGASSVILPKGCVDAWEPKVLRAGAGAHFRIQLRTNVEWNLINNYVPEDSVVFLADNKENPIESIDDRTARELQRAEMLRTAETEVVGKETLVRDSSFDDPDALEVYKKIPLTVKNYSQALFTDYCPVTLVVGGESHGLSGCAYKLGYERNGIKLKIPLENQVDSLNSGIAMGILAYELRRQLSMLKSGTV